MIKLEIIADSPQQFASELVGAFAVLAQRIPTAQARPAPIEVAPTPQETGSEKKKRKAPAAKTGGDMPDENPVDLEDLTSAPTQAQVKEKLIALLEAKGDEAPPKLLAEFGVEKLSKLATGDYAKAIARADEMIAEKDK